MNILDPIAQEIQDKTGLKLTKQTVADILYYQTELPNNQILLIGIPRPVPDHKPNDWLLHNQHPHQPHYNGIHLLIIKTTKENAQKAVYSNPQILTILLQPEFKKFQINTKLIDLTHPNSIEKIIDTIKTLTKETK